MLRKSASVFALAASVFALSMTAARAADAPRLYNANIDAEAGVTFNKTAPTYYLDLDHTGLDVGWDSYPMELYLSGGIWASDGDSGGDVEARLEAHPFPKNPYVSYAFGAVGAEFASGDSAPYLSVGVGGDLTENITHEENISVDTNGVFSFGIDLDGEWALADRLTLEPSLSIGGQFGDNSDAMALKASLTLVYELTPSVQPFASVGWDGLYGDSSVEFSSAVATVGLRAKF